MIDWIDRLRLNVYCRSATLSPGGVTPFADLVSGLNTTTEAPSPFMKYGASYGGQSASRILGQTLAEVAVGVTLDNWSRWALIEPEGGALGLSSSTYLILWTI